MTTAERVKKMTSYFLALRRLQDKTEADFISSLGGLSLPQLNVLNIIGDTEPCTMGEIAKRASLSLSSVTLIVDKLARNKLVSRVRSKTDRRIVYAKLAPEGEKIYKVQIEHMQVIGQKMFSLLSDEEQEMLLKILHKITMTGLALAE